MKLFVTGPQRSGTTFISNCLAKSHGIPIIDEAEFEAHFYGRFRFLAKKNKNWVVQGPALFHKIFDVYHDFPDVTFVVIKRNVEDILKSQKRISWSDDMERAHMNVAKNDVRPIAEIKYCLWDKWKNDLPSWVEYSYYDFELHPYWVGEDLRLNFTSKQWKSA